jgi:protein gp37
MASKIDWLDGGEVWNPLAGCSPVSPGCANCYACRLLATRLKHLPDFKELAHMALRQIDATVLGAKPVPRWTGEVRLLPHKLEQPLRWRKPRRIFVCDKGDLFHELVPNEYIAAVFGVMAACPQHTFILLTKRPERMVKLYAWMKREALKEPSGIGGAPGVSEAAFCALLATQSIGLTTPVFSDACNQEWPLPNAWAGATCEDQPRADERILLLLQVPAAVRWVSYEPGLGALCLNKGAHLGVPLADGTRWHGSLPMLDWVVIGCESGPRPRPFNQDWAQSVVDQCKAAGVPCFTKQLRKLDGTMLKSAELAKRGWPVQYPEAR